MRFTKRLAKFLADEGALTRFIDNLHGSGTSPNFLIEDVSSGFVWRNTPEGEEYWEDLHYKYKLLKMLRHNEDN
jgi:hypothetical protein